MNPTELGLMIMNWLGNRAKMAAGQTVSGFKQSFGTASGLPPTQLDQLPIFAMQSALRFQNAQLTAFSQTGGGFGQGTDGIEKMTASLVKYRKELENAGVSQRDFAERMSIMSASSLKTGKDLVAATKDATLFARATGIDFGTLVSVERSTRAAGVSAVGLGEGIRRISPISSPQVEELMKGIAGFEDQYANQGIGKQGAIQTALAAFNIGQTSGNPVFQGANSLNLARAFVNPDLDPANGLMLASNPLRRGEGLYEWNLRKNEQLADFNKNYLGFLQGMGGNAAMQATGLPAGILQELLKPENLKKINAGGYNLSTPEGLEKAAALVTGTQPRVGAQAEDAIRGLGDKMRAQYDSFSESNKTFQDAVSMFKLSVANMVTPGGIAGRIGLHSLSIENTWGGQHLKRINDLSEDIVKLPWKLLGKLLTPGTAGAEEMAYSSSGGYKFKAGTHIKPDAIGDLTAQLLVARGLKDFVVTDEFRTDAEQASLVRRGRSRGRSPHQDGNAIDISLGTATRGQLQEALRGISGLDVRMDDGDHWHVGPRKGASQDEIAKIMSQLVTALNNLHSTVQRSALPADSTTVRRSGR